MLTPHVIPRTPLPEPPFLVAGLGRAGLAATEALLTRFGPDAVTAWDGATSKSMHRIRAQLEARGVTTWLGTPGKRMVKRVNCVVKSPGISPAAPVIQRARDREKLVIDELELGWRMHGIPVVAITGTNGKSTVAGLCNAVLSSAGSRVQLAGNTQFGPPLSAAPDQLDWLVCEVSSFQLEGCNHFLPEVGVFTNLTAEHLGRHRTMGRYGECKRRMFVRDGLPVPRAVIDIDGAFGRELADELELLGGLVTRVGFADEADYQVRSADWDLDGASMLLRTPSGELSLETALPGAYNARNIAAALAVADVIEIDRASSTRTIGACGGPPGRFERIDAGQPFHVIVDNAHTPDGLEQFLTTVRRGMASAGTLSVILGPDGRPGTAMGEMGAIARRLADRVVLTTSGYLGTPPILTLGTLLNGAKSETGGRLEVILDRRRAFERTLGRTSTDDVVVIPGRGSRREMRPDPKGVAVPFDDRNVSYEVLNQLELATGLCGHPSDPTEPGSCSPGIRAGSSQRELEPEPLVGVIERVPEQLS